LNGWIKFSIFNFLQKILSYEKQVSEFT